MSSRSSRLDRLLAKSLAISRDKVRNLLAQQRIRVDGKITLERDLLVTGFNRVTLDEQIIQSRQAVYLMLHKPRGVLSATKDLRHPVALDLVEHHAKTDLHIAGRLDLHSSGLLLLTNDSQWSRHLSSPDSGVIKQYDVTVKNPLDAEYVAAFAAGMHFPFENITTRPAQLEITGTNSARVSLQEGRYHQIKRMFGRFRNPVLSIHRFAIGKLLLDANLQPGAWRELTKDEIILD